MDFKFKIGQQVMVRPDLSYGKQYKRNGNHQYIGVNEHMQAKRGKMVTIQAVWEDTYRIKEDKWQYTDDMFVPHLSEDELIAKLIKGEIDTHTYNTWLACKEGE